MGEAEFLQRSPKSKKEEIISQVRGQQQERERERESSAIERARWLFEDEREAIIKSYEGQLKACKERYENELFAYEQDKAKLGLTLNDLDRKLVEKEETFLHVQERLQRAENVQYDTSEENNKLTAKFRAVSLYASDLQRQVDALKRDNF